MKIRKRTCACLVVASAVLFATANGALAEKHTPPIAPKGQKDQLQQQPSPTLPSKCKNPKGCYGDPKGSGK